VVSAQVELLSAEVLTEMFQSPHDGQYFLSGDSVIYLSLIQRLTEVGYYSLLSALYLGQHFSNPYVTRVCVNDETLPWLRLSKSRGSRDGFLWRLEGGLNFWSPLIPVVTCWSGY
jgi:hypothetical protein